MKITNTSFSWSDKDFVELSSLEVSGTVIALNGWLCVDWLGACGGAATNEH
jgi:hypothetical protein